MEEARQHPTLTGLLCRRTSGGQAGGAVGGVRLLTHTLPNGVLTRTLGVCLRVHLSACSTGCLQLDAPEQGTAVRFPSKHTSVSAYHVFNTQTIGQHILGWCCHTWCALGVNDCSPGEEGTTVPVGVVP
jgi:hypothetical protein